MRTPQFLYAAAMKDIDTHEHEALRRFLKLERQRHEWTQEELAGRMGRRQGFVSGVESGQHPVSVVEFLQFAEALGFDACQALEAIKRRPSVAPTPRTRKR